MKPPHHSYLLPFLVYLMLFAQPVLASTKMDSLQTALKQCSSDADCAPVLLKLGFKYLSEKPDSSLYYFERVAAINGLEPSLQARGSFGLAEANDELKRDSVAARYHLLAFEQYAVLKDSVAMTQNAQMAGNAMIESGHSKLAIEWLEKAIAIGTAIDNAQFVALAYSNIGIAYYYKANFAKASESFIASVKWRDTHDMPVDAAILINISVISRELNNWPLSLEYSERALELAQADSNESLVRMSYQNIGTIYTRLKDYELAEEYLRKANEINLRLNDSSHIARYHTGMADNFLAQHNEEQTVFHYEQAKRFLPKKGDPRQRMFAFLNLARTYERQSANGTDKKALRQAVKNALVAYNMTKAMGLRKNQSECAKLLFNTYAALNEPNNAVPFGKEYLAVNDSLLSQDKMKAVAELQERYEAEKRETEIANLNEQNAIKSENLAQGEALQSNQQLIIVLLALGIGITAVLLVWIYRIYLQNKKTNAILEEKNVTIAAQNEENETLLKEIHHRVKNNLQVISSLLDLQSGGVEDASALSALSDGQGRVRSMALIHQYLYQNDSIGRIAFTTYAHDLAKQIGSVYKDQQVKLLLEESDIMLDIDTAIPLGLILNELLSNAYKYAFSNTEKPQLRIQLKENSSDHFELLVADNGPGLPDDFDAQKAKSLGLRLVRRLSKQLYGSVTYSGDEGTAFCIRFKGTEARKDVA